MEICRFDRPVLQPDRRVVFSHDGLSTTKVRINSRRRLDGGIRPGDDRKAVRRDYDHLTIPVRLLKDYLAATL